MARNKILAIILSGSIIISFAGCGNKTDDNVLSETTGMTSMPATDIVTACPTPIPSGLTVILQTAEIKETATIGIATKSPLPIGSQSIPTVEQGTANVQTTTAVATTTPKPTVAPTATPKLTQKQTSAPTITATPTPTKVPVTPSPTKTASPTPTKAPTLTPTPDFDINYWIDFAKSYAVSIGLEVDSDAIYCWDNPIRASASSRYLERDITGRLNRYKNVEGFEAIWAWAEEVTPGVYDLFIGYA